MGYGDQISAEHAHEQMDYAVAHGVNFWDTAEMYPVPPKAETYSRTETIIGEWFAKTGKRSEVVLATKVLGPGRYPHVRDGDNRLNAKNISAAVDASLERLQTDYIDLYQLHWPDRNVNAFGVRGYAHDADEQMTPIVETLEALQEQVNAGKIRQVGLSNETPWGTIEFLRLAEEKGLPRMVSVQNVYNLLNRHYELGMAEVSSREDIGLLAYSPLGFGVLGGRYLDGGKPEGGRFVCHPTFVARYRQEHIEPIIKEYKALAEEYGLSIAQLSLAFVNQQSFVTSNIMGASNLDQLKENIESIDIELSDDVVKGLNKIHERYPNPVS